MSAGIALIALVLDALIAYPKALQTNMGHPVQWMGAFIEWGDEKLNRQYLAANQRKLMGVLMLAVLIMLTGLSAFFLRRALHMLPLGWLWEALVASVFLAQKQLGDMVRDVARALDKSLEEGREAVSHIVGRDTNRLDEAEISRAAIETLAENASDGVIAPLFWLVLFGLPGIAIYKAINTADSMIGHLDDRHAAFGWASAKLDDVANWIPARLTAMIFALAAWLTSGADGRAAWAIAKRDANKHASPNAGWPEAAMAGALGFGLGGPRNYDGERVDLPQMGDGRRDLNAGDIRRALTLYVTAGIVSFAFVGLLAALRL